MAHKALRGRKKPTKGINKKLKRSDSKKTGKGRAAKNASVVPPQRPELDFEDSEGPVKKHDKKAARLIATAERHHRALYPGGERVLLVGEGNFSFARSFCERLGSGAGVYATAFDGEAVLKKKFPDAAAARKDIEEKFGGTTIAGVDGTRLHEVREFRKAFVKIVFNFPHLGGGESDVEKSVADHKQLLSAFFVSAAKCLDPDQDAYVHVALKVGEPYKSWKVVQVARAANPNLELMTAVDFAFSAWPGYTHRRTKGFDARHSKDDNEELAKGAKVYVFVQRKKLSK